MVDDNSAWERGSGVQSSPYFMHPGVFARAVGEKEEEAHTRGGDAAVLFTDHTTVCVRNSRESTQAPGANRWA